ncbi:radical SAM/SPASM domain-containing protein [Magnetospirillum sp. SS-4]|uniref:radical SAM protein n=1 Tax=Magnetospirillum sp. SS-4 TaxID=2681465 RepID=UPI0013806444|nr:radical SAM/SPASM domain-containing protein [Magnetospirillum sp. SS-4]CAA7614465.1 Radical SAM superfamily enzyme [Magnetospirillum sp. SS-4]
MATDNPAEMNTTMDPSKDILPPNIVMADSFSPFKPSPQRGLMKYVRAGFGIIKLALIRRALNDDLVYERYIRENLARLFVANTTICNARCVFCPQQFHVDKKQAMPFDIFADAIENFVAHGGRLVTLNSNNGDPLADPGLIDKIRHARKVGLPVLNFSTNGILLSRGTLVQDIAALVDEIDISLPGFDREDYKRVYGVDRAEAVLDGLIKLIEAKRAANSPLRILLALRIDRPLEEVMADEGMRQLKPYLDDGTVVIDPDQIYSEMETWSDQITAESLPGIMTLRTDVPVRTRPCKRMMNDVFLLADGQVRICACRIKLSNYDELVIGDTRTQPLADIVHGPAHRALLQRVAAGDWPEVCQDCTLYQAQDLPRQTWLAMAWDLLGGLFRR